MKKPAWSGKGLKKPMGKVTIKKPVAIKKGIKKPMEMKPKMGTRMPKAVQRESTPMFNEGF